MARRERFRADRPVMPWLLKLTWARAVDHLRRRTTRERALAHMGRALKQTSLSRALPDAVVEAEVQALVRHSINALPLR